MSNVVVSFTMSLDGFVAGVGADVEQPMGEGGERLHEWLFRADRNEIDIAMAERISASIGAVILGRRTFDVGIGPWGDTPFPAPCFVLTHEVRDVLVQNSGNFVFVNDGIDSALQQAKAAARGKDVVLMGADLAQQFLKAGLVEEIVLQVAPVLMGGGRRLFEQLGTEQIELEQLQVLGSPRVAHLRYRVAKK
jgi:dihydrofolate reductase